MAEGAIIAEGTPDDIAANPDVIDAYLGSHHDSDFESWDDDEIARAESADDTPAGEEESP